MWQSSRPDGYCGVADFELDGVPRSSSCAAARSTSLNGQTGADLAGQLPIPGGGEGRRAQHRRLRRRRGPRHRRRRAATRYVVVELRRADQLDRAVAGRDQGRLVRAGPARRCSTSTATAATRSSTTTSGTFASIPGVEPDCELDPPGPACDGIMTDAEVLFIDINSSRTRERVPGRRRRRRRLQGRAGGHDQQPTSAGAIGTPASRSGTTRSTTGSAPCRSGISTAITSPTSGSTAASRSSRTARGWSPTATPTTRIGPTSRAPRTFARPTSSCSILRADLLECPSLNLTVDVVNIGCLGVGAGVQILVLRGDPRLPRDRPDHRPAPGRGQGDRQHRDHAVD